MRCPARSDAPPGCRCPPTKRTWDPAAAGRACRTSCRNARGTAPSASSCRASRQAARRFHAFRSSRSHAPRRSTAGTAQGWSATSDAPARASGLPGNCRAAACCLPPSRTVSKKRQVRRAVSRSAVVSATESGSVPSIRRRQTCPSRDGRRQHPQNHEWNRDQRAAADAANATKIAAETASAHAPAIIP